MTDRYIAYSLLTNDEQRVLQLSGKLADELDALPVLHESDMSENIRDIHNIQNRIMARAELRNRRIETIEDHPN